MKILEGSPHIEVRDGHIMCKDEFGSAVPTRNGSNVELMAGSKKIVIREEANDRYYLDINNATMTPEGLKVPLVQIITG